MKITRPRFYCSSQVSGSNTISQGKKTVHVSLEQNSETFNHSIKSNSLSLFDDGYHVILSSPPSTHITSPSYEIPEDSLLSLKKMNLPNESNKSSFIIPFRMKSQNRKVETLTNRIAKLNVTENPIEEIFEPKEKKT